MNRAQNKRRRARSRGEEGIAIPMAITAIAILAVLVADMHESTSTAHASAIAQEEQLRAEFLARSALDLTRLLVVKEPEIRQTVAPLYQLLLRRAPPQIPVWNFADAILQPFFDYDGAVSTAKESGIDLSRAEGIGSTGGTVSMIGGPENAKINVNDPLFLDGVEAKRSVAMQLFARLGGYQSPSPYDPIFNQKDPDGQFTTRLDVVSNMIDWWDTDQERSVFDPGAAAVTSAGGEDDVYQTFRDPYKVKNAPFDSLEEIRMIRGVGDDFWATFVQPNPDDPREDFFTIYASGSVNANEAPPEVLLARVCSYLTDQTLCNDPVEATKFVEIVRTIRSIAPVPWFSGQNDFLNFLEGKGGAQDLYPMLKSMLGDDNPLLFRPITIAADRRQKLDQLMTTEAKILTLQATARVGRGTVRIRTVLNVHDRWSPPPPNAGTLPPLGVYHYWRID